MSHGGVGYEIISFDYEDGTGDAPREIDLEFRGPMLDLLCLAGIAAFLVVQLVGVAG